MLESKCFDVKVGGVNAAARTVEGMASFKEVDRGGDLMLPTAFDKTIKNFLNNPVLAWCHNIITMPPLGKILDFEVRDNGSHFKSEFDTDAFSDLIFRKYKSRSMRAFSVQFMPHVVREPNDEEKALHGPSLKRVIEEGELLEISCVPVPMVANALVGKSFADFDMKAFMKLTQEAVEPVASKKNLHERIEAAMEMAAQIGILLTEALEAAGPREGAEATDDGGTDGGSDDGGGGGGGDQEPTEAQLTAALGELEKVTKQLEEVSA